MINKRLMYAQGRRVGFEPGGMAGEHGMGAGVGADGQTGGQRSGNNDDNTNREKGIMSQFQGPKGTTGNINDFTGDKDGVDRSAVGPSSKYATNKFREGMVKSIDKISKDPKYGGGGFFDSGLGKFIKTIGKAALFAYAPPIVGKINTGLQVAKVGKNFLDTTGLTEKIGLQDVNVKNAFSNIGKTSTKTGPKDPPREGGDGDSQQNALMAEYLLLLQKMEQGILQKEEQGRFNSLKSRLGKAKGGDVPPRSRLTADNILHNQAKKSEVKQFTPPERTGILQKLFGIDTDKLYDQGFDSMNKYRERNPDNPTEVLQLAGGKLSNLRHGVSTSLLRDDILKKINPGSYEMKEAPPSMNFEELKMSEEGPNKAAKGVASLLAYLGAGANEIGPGFFSKETMEDLTANLLGLMKTDVYDTPEDKASMLNDILENDTGGINTYLQSLAPKEKYQEDAMLFPPMRQDKMRDQDLLFMKAEEEYDEKIKNLGLGDMDG